MARPRRFWIYLVSALLGIVLLTGAGVAAVMITGANVNRLIGEWGSGPVTPRAPSNSVTAQLDPSAEVVVLNGTTMLGFGGLIDEIITENEWGTVILSGEAETNDLAISAVFYVAEGDEAAALGLARELGGVSVFQNDAYADYGARLFVLLGADYAGPGSERFVEGGQVFAPQSPGEDLVVE